MPNKQVVVFMLNNEYYGIDISYIKSTKIPDTPEFIEGIINFRGDIIPIISMRRTFMLKDKESDKDTRIKISN